MASKVMVKNPSVLQALGRRSESQNMNANNNAVQSSGSENNDDSKGHASDVASNDVGPDVK